MTKSEWDTSGRPSSSYSHGLQGFAEPGFQRLEVFYDHFNHHPERPQPRLPQAAMAAVAARARGPEPREGRDQRAAADRAASRQSDQSQGSSRDPAAAKRPPALSTLTHRLTARAKFSRPAAHTPSSLPPPSRNDCRYCRRQSN